MREYKFYGASDDLLEMEGAEREEISCHEGAAYHLKSEDGELIVYGVYAPHPTEGAAWVVGVSMVDEGQCIPEWPMRFDTHDRRYNPMLVVEAPDDTKASIVKQSE